MTLNPSIFDFKRDFENGTNDIPYKEFVIVHEIGHCIDHIDRISFSKKWQAISGWKKCDISDVIPEGYDRYIEKRRGREAAGNKKSGWVYKEGQTSAGSILARIQEKTSQILSRSRYSKAIPNSKEKVERKSWTSSIGSYSR